MEQSLNPIRSKKPEISADSLKANRTSNGIKVLMISMDNGVLDQRSESSERMQFYSTVLDELVIIVLNSDGVVKRLGNLTVYPTSRNKLLSFFTALYLGWKLLRQNSFDVISAQDPFATGVIGYILKKTAGRSAALQIQIHTGLFTPYFLSESLKTRFYVFLARFLLPRADCIKSVSEGIRHYLVEKLGIKSENIAVLPVFVFFDRFLKGEIKTDLKEKYPQFDFILLMASRLVSQKNIPMAIHAVGQLVRKHPRLGLVIVGSGPDEESLKLKVKSFLPAGQGQAGKLENSVVFEPWSTDLVSYYKTADLFLLTSDYEGWARTVLEAMASGLPVIMTDVGVAGEVVKTGENGIVVPVKDENALTSAIEDLCENRLKREKIGKAGLETVVNLDLRNKQKYLKLYLESFQPCFKNKT